MNRPYLSYSGWKKFKDCAFAYWNAYIGHTPVDGLDDRLGSIYGSVVGKIFEDFYTHQWWRSPRPVKDMVARVEKTVDWVIKRETTPYRDRLGGTLLWRGDGEGQNPKALYANREELVEDVRETVGRGCRIIRHHRLLGPVADAEVKLDSVVGNYLLGGRADFIIERTKPYHDLCILDGKGSRWRAKYVDHKQLLWYALLYRSRFGKVPDKLAFLFWRYEPNNALDWVEFVEGDLDDLLEDVLEVLRRIEKGIAQLPVRASLSGVRKVFRPAAESQGRCDACRFCPWANVVVCPKGAEVVRKMSGGEA